MRWNTGQLAHAKNCEQASKLPLTQIVCHSVKPRDPFELPEDLLRQLEAIERSANELSPMGLARSAFEDEFIPIKLRPLSPSRHALIAELRGATREASRVRILTIVLLTIGTLLAAAGAIFLQLEYFWLSIVILAVSGGLVGLGGVAAYQANERIQYLNQELDKSESA